jgi:hypothetical protein
MPIMHSSYSGVQRDPWPCRRWARVDQFTRSPSQHGKITKQSLEHFTFPAAEHWRPSDQSTEFSWRVIINCSKSLLVHACYRTLFPNWKLIFYLVYRRSWSKRLSIKMLDLPTVVHLCPTTMMPKAKSIQYFWNPTTYMSTTLWRSITRVTTYDEIKMSWIPIPSVAISWCWRNPRMRQILNSPILSGMLVYSAYSTRTLGLGCGTTCPGGWSSFGCGGFSVLNFQTWLG